MMPFWMDEYNIANIGIESHTLGTFLDTSTEMGCLGAYAEIFILNIVHLPDDSILFTVSI